MIPFNHLGWFFKYLGPTAYPRDAIKELCHFIRPLPQQASLLDLGSGTGVLSEFAYKCRDDLRFVAIDPSEGMLKFSPPYVETHTARAEQLPFDEAGFELVIIGEALHHFQDPDIVIQEIVRVLKDDGRLFIYEFDPSRSLGKYICLAEKMAGEPANFFKPKVLKNMLEGYGFSVDITLHGWRYTVKAQLTGATDL